MSNDNLYSYANAAADPLGANFNYYAPTHRSDKKPVNSDVLNFQRYWNSNLPKGVTPLAEDGIRGPKTEFAEKQWANNARALEYGSSKPTTIAQPMAVPAASESLAAQAPRKEVPDWARGTILEFTGQY